MAEEEMSYEEMLERELPAPKPPRPLTWGWVFWAVLLALFAHDFVNVLVGGIFSGLVVGP